MWTPTRLFAECLNFLSWRKLCTVHHFLSTYIYYKIDQDRFYGQHQAAIDNVEWKAAVGRLIFPYTNNKGPFIQGVTLRGVSCRRFRDAALALLTQYKTLLNLCTSFNNTSPCFTTVSYCAFLRLGRVVSTMPCTLSIEACKRPAAMKRDSSLEGK